MEMESEFNQEVQEIVMPEKRKRGRPKKTSFEIAVPKKLRLAKKATDIPPTIKPVELEAMRDMEPHKLEMAVITICCDQFGNIIAVTNNIQDTDTVRIKGALKALRVVSSAFEDKLLARLG